MNLILNNGIAEHKDAETTMIYTHVLKKAGRASEVRRMRFESFWQKAILYGTGKDSELRFKTP